MDMDVDGEEAIGEFGFFCLFIKIGALMYTQMHIYPQSWIMISSSTMLFCIMCLPTCMLVFIVILFISFILFTPKVKMIK